MCVYIYIKGYLVFFSVIFPLSQARQRILQGLWLRVSLPVFNYTWALIPPSWVTMSSYLITLHCQKWDLLDQAWWCLPVIPAMQEVRGS
jgi:hypothetical protein